MMADQTRLGSYITTSLAGEPVSAFMPPPLPPNPPLQVTPDLQDLSNESEATKKMYGLDNPITEDFGRQCLMARRFSEKGVRFVQVSHTYKWDQHERLKRDHEQNAREVDKPIAALLQDLKSRGLLEDTLVLWGGEFGRTPTAQGSDGRDHNPEAFTMWMAGGGVKAGLSYGSPATSRSPFWPLLSPPRAGRSIRCRASAFSPGTSRSRRRMARCTPAIRTSPPGSPREACPPCCA